jgi:hypothetical protein
MPTVYRIGAYRFFFYASDGAEPPHVHVERGDALAKFWLTPVFLANSHGFRGPEINRLQLMVQEHEQDFLGAWNDFFNDCPALRQGAERVVH